MRFLSSRARLAAVLTMMLVAVTGAHAREVQLAGIRLGDHAVNLLDVYGTPDGIAVGEGQAITSQQSAPGAPNVGQPGDIGGLTGAGPGGPGMPGMGGGMPGMGGGMPGMMGGPGMGGGPPGMDAGMPGAAGPGAFPGGAPGGPGMPGMGGGGPGMGGGPPGMGGGMPGAGGGIGGAAGAGGLQTEPFPVWALAVWVELGPNEVEWVYNEGPVVLGFVLDRDGFVRVVAVAAEQCNYARTALWRPHRYVKLGDDFKRVIYRYGYPDETITFSSSGPGEASVGGGQISVTFGSTTRTYSRDCILRYTQNNNIEFTLHNMVVTRIHIWESD